LHRCAFEIANRFCAIYARASVSGVTCVGYRVGHGFWAAVTLKIVEVTRVIRSTRTESPVLPKVRV
jgi:hypothetical protein